MERNHYAAPRILQETSVSLECNLLGGPSVVDNISSVETTGQEVEVYDYSTTTTFNHEWE